LRAFARNRQKTIWNSLTANNFYHLNITGNVKKQCKHGIVKIELIEYNEECIKGWNDWPIYDITGQCDLNKEKIFKKRTNIVNNRRLRTPSATSSGISS